MIQTFPQMKQCLCSNGIIIIIIIIIISSSSSSSSTIDCIVFDVC